MTRGNRATVRRALCALARIFVLFAFYETATRGKTASSERGEQLAFPRALQRWKRGFLMRILANGVSSLSLFPSYRNLRSAWKYDLVLHPISPPSHSLSLYFVSLPHSPLVAISRVYFHTSVQMVDFPFDLTIFHIT